MFHYGLGLEVMILRETSYFPFDAEICAPVSVERGKQITGQQSGMKRSNIIEHRSVHAKEFVESELDNSTTRFD